LQLLAYQHLFLLTKLSSNPSLPLLLPQRFKLVMPFKVFFNYLMTLSKLNSMNKHVLIKETKLKKKMVLKSLVNTIVWLRTTTESLKNAHKTENMLKANSNKPQAELHSLMEDSSN
jgi:hypothetical protein